MTKLKRFLSTMLMLVLFLNMIPPAHAAEGNPGKLTMTASGTAVNHGETVTVTIAANQSFVTRGAGITVSYDAAVLEPILESCQTAVPFAVSGPLTVGGQTLLRISSFPGEEGHTVNADEALAVLDFRTTTPGENIKVAMSAAYLYDTDLNPIDLQKAEPVQIDVAAVAVTGITLDASILNLEIGESRTIEAAIAPANASDKTILWTSSDESIVTVKNGVLTGCRIGTATVTASAGDFTAECSVAVVTPPDVGYFVAMPEEKAAVVGDTITISPAFGNNKEISAYNAYDITIAYDPAMLLLTSDWIEDATVTKGDGTVNVIRYGSDLGMDTAPFSLTFIARKTGATTVRVNSARVDHSENAVISNAAKAYLSPGETPVVIGGYPVSLPDDFLGEAVAEPDADYTFEARDKFYDYTFDGTTMGGQSVDVTDNGNGTFTIERVTGKLVIQSQKVGKTFDVVIAGNGYEDMKGNSTARYMTDYTATLREDDSHTYNVHITVNGVYYPVIPNNGDIYTIPGKDITGKIIFTVDKKEIGSTPPSTTHYDITFEGSGVSAAGGNTASVAGGSGYRFTLNKEDGYRYAVTYRMGDGSEKAVRPDADGIYTIQNVTGDLIITVAKELDEQNYSIEVYRYITLHDGKTMYLVLVSGGLDDSKAFSYGGRLMYYSEVYQAWCILAVETSKLTAGLARRQISVQNGQMDAVDAVSYDVNMTGLVDINDAQLVYDLYNGKHEDFTVINMHRFLNADVNADKKITVTDAAGVVSAIK